MIVGSGWGEVCVWGWWWDGDSNSVGGGCYSWSDGVMRVYCDICQGG